MEGQNAEHDREFRTSGAEWTKREIAGKDDSRALEALDAAASSALTGKWIRPGD
jgi:hypothetical protein